MSAAGELQELLRGRNVASVPAGAALPSRVRIVAPVARGYTCMAYGFVARFVLPLLSMGTFRAFMEG